MRNLSVEDTYFKPNQINVNGKLIDLSIPKIMGILNYTQDSFYSGSRLNSDSELLKQTEKHLMEGATFIDIGAFSTRPNAKDVPLSEEISRISYAVHSIRTEFPESIISVDTFRGDVAQAAIDHGAGMINDISGFSFDEKMLEVVSKNKIPYILMHLQGTFDTMHHSYSYKDICSDVMNYFLEKVAILNENLVYDILLDPGFGFSKSTDQNYELFHQMEKFHLLERPILIGISRKSMIYKKLGISTEESLNATSALNAIAITKGASILRVHDVTPAMEIVKLLTT